MIYDVNALDCRHLVSIRDKIPTGVHILRCLKRHHETNSPLALFRVCMRVCADSSQMQSGRRILFTKFLDTAAIREWSTFYPKNNVKWDGVMREKKSRY